MANGGLSIGHLQYSRRSQLTTKSSATGGERRRTANASEATAKSGAAADEIIRTAGRAETIGRAADARL